MRERHLRHGSRLRDQNRGTVYTIATLALRCRLAATTYWSDGPARLNANFHGRPGPALRVRSAVSVSTTGLYTAGNSVGLLSCDGQAFSGVTNDGGAGVAVTVASIEAHTKESERVANSGMVMREVLQLAPVAYLRAGATEGRMRHRCAFNPQVRWLALWKLRAWGNDLPRRAGTFEDRGGPPSMIALRREVGFGLQVGRAGHGLCFLLPNE